jgi:hypothetical protein
MPVKPSPTNKQQINIFMHPQMQGLFAALLQLLAPYPEVRAKVADLLLGETRNLTQFLA